MARKQKRTDLTSRQIINVGFLASELKRETKTVTVLISQAKEIGEAIVAAKAGEGFVRFLQRTLNEHSGIDRKMFEAMKRDVQNGSVAALRSNLRDLNELKH